MAELVPTETNALATANINNESQHVPVPKPLDVTVPPKRMAKKTSAGGHSPDRGWLLLGGLKTKISLFERLSSHCLLVMKPGHAASQSNRNHDDDSENCKDTHVSPPSVFGGVQYFWRAVCDALAQMKSN